MGQQSTPVSNEKKGGTNKLHRKLGHEKIEPPLNMKQKLFRILLILKNSFSNMDVFLKNGILYKILRITLIFTVTQKTAAKNIIHSLKKKKISSHKKMKQKTFFWYSIIFIFHKKWEIFLRVVGPDSLSARAFTR